MSLTIWHNPSCSKSREALALLEERGEAVSVYKYLDEAPSVEEIKKVLRLLNIRPRALMRTKEELYKELELAKVDDDELLIEAMSRHSKLIERPIIMSESKAIIGRPPELVRDF